MDDNTSPPAANDVGPGKPPLETRWKPGQSGNPKGRPRAKSLKTMFLEAAFAKPNRRSASDRAGEYSTQIEAAIGLMFDSAAHGGEKARKEILELWSVVIGNGDPDARCAQDAAPADAAATQDQAPCTRQEFG